MQIKKTTYGIVYFVDSTSLKNKTDKHTFRKDRPLNTRQVCFVQITLEEDFFRLQIMVHYVLMNFFETAAVSQKCT